MLEKSIIHFINHLLSTELWAQQRLQKHVGKSVELIMGLVRLQLAITQHGYVDISEDTKIADGRLIIEPDIVLHIMQHGRQAAAQRVHITGEAELVATVGEVLQYLRWDIEQDLSQFVGDIAAHRILRTAKQLGKQSVHRANRFTKNMTEYLTEETPMLVTQQQFVICRTELHQLRDQIARLEKRIQKLND